MVRVARGLGAIICHMESQKIVDSTLSIAVSTPTRDCRLEFCRRALMVDHSASADVRFARTNIQIYDAYVVDLYQWVCARYFAGVKGGIWRRECQSIPIERSSIFNFSKPKPTV
jgi:hypothetical protein